MLPELSIHLVIGKDLPYYRILLSLCALFGTINFLPIKGKIFHIISRGTYIYFIHYRIIVHSTNERIDTMWNRKNRTSKEKDESTDKPFHTLTIENLFSVLDSSAEGT